jgi:hypothetical protein
MTKLERIAGLTILLGFICTLDVAFFDHLSAQLSAVIGELAQAVSLKN